MIKMNNPLRRSSFAKLVLVALWLSVLPTQSIDAQRERQTSASQNPAVTQPTPSPNPSPVATPSAPSGVVQPKTGTSTKLLAELRNRISEIIDKPELASAMVGIKVASLDTGRVLFEENATKLLRPASNMKIYTVATALDRLSPDYRFTTSVYAPTKPDSAGVIKGNLTIFGRGDPSIAARFNNGDYFKGIDELATRIAAAGVKRVDGDLVGDESYFVGPQYGSGWEWDDLTWYYGAEVTPLTVNDNALDLFIKPASEVGKPAVITTGPPDPLLKIVNRVTTLARGTRRDISISRDLGEDVITINGSIALDDKGYTGGIGISHPAMLFMYLLRTSLAQRGVTIKGQSRTETFESKQNSQSPGRLYALTSLPQGLPTPPTEIATLQSPPFSLIAAQTLKPSQNLYTELILRTLGKVSPAPATTTSNIGLTTEDLGLETVKAFLKGVGIQPESLVLSDGSGLSRNDMITADASVQLLTFMSRHRYADVFRAALPIAGVDGTLRTRFRNTPAENNLRAKTGSLSSAASLSGYVTSAAGEKLVFSIMVNNYPRDVEPRLICIDPIAVLLASFTGKSE
ncbi:MAG TPA: D-alanyl-D-alanine carboxypeptidase/D-alanyl-D-alanine-endopeptidase [Pyrinomonadaceae bacterium]|jgi:D-alanyl-D-alanine carboxypeptidase, serine-type, PBP4 family|nr:D-alanyl-D-alanine carboxypeptidase/D-alanyl-D-alanine-endopeptidase [Pyrinomonadaceae bacterium]